jgi:hypothetical protein
VQEKRKGPAPLQALLCVNVSGGNTMEADELRSTLIAGHQLRNVDVVYMFYYDETNNIRKFHLVEDGFNVSDPGNFVLGGILHKGLMHRADFGHLIKSLNLQESTRELKLRHIGKGGFEEILSSSKLGTVLQWIQENNFYIHYFNLNIVYWSLIDIVDSVLSRTAGDIVLNHLMIKSDLYQVLMTDRSSFVIAARQFGFPNIAIDNVKTFSSWLVTFARKHINILSGDRENVLRQFLDQLERVCELPFLTDGKDGVLIEDFAGFYFRTLYLFKNSQHVFDREENIEKHLKDFRMTTAGKPLNNSRFVDSESDPAIQVSDVIVGLLGKYFTFVRVESHEYLRATRSRLNSRQKRNIELLTRIIDQSDSASNGFFCTVASVEEQRKHEYFLSGAVGA